MEVKRIQQQSVETVVDMLCDICGKSCKGECDYEYATLVARWGYDSSKDGEKHYCQMCEQCYDKVRVFIDSLGGKVTVTQEGLTYVA